MEQACGSFHALFLFLQPGSLAWPCDPPFTRKSCISAVVSATDLLLHCANLQSPKGVRMMAYVCFLMDGWWTFLFTGWIIKQPFCNMCCNCNRNCNARSSIPLSQHIRLSEVCLFCMYIFLLFLPPDIISMADQELELWITEQSESVCPVLCQIMGMGPLMLGSSEASDARHHRQEFTRKLSSPRGRGKGSRRIPQVRPVPWLWVGAHYLSTVTSGREEDSCTAQAQIQADRAAQNLNPTGGLEEAAGVNCGHGQFCPSFDPRSTNAASTRHRGRMADAHVRTCVHADSALWEKVENMPLDGD